METFKCTGCNKDLSLGLILFSKPEIYPEQFKYLHCSECGKTYLIDVSSIKIEEVDYSKDEIGEDILNSLDSVFDDMSNFMLKEGLDDTKKTCGNCDNTCNCIH